ncbi:MAG: T9SS type A sorting domain-containing protein [Bacteroidota bacterium]
MKRHLLLLGSLCLLGMINSLSAQEYLDHFDNNDPAFTNGSGFSYSESDSELTVTGDGSGGPFDPFVYQPHDQDNGTAKLVDATTTNKVFIRAKASNVGTQLRMDLQDVDGFATSQAGITKTLTTDYEVLEFDFTNNYIDGGFGGTPCMSGPCPVNGSEVQQLLFFIDPGAGGFNGTVIIDYIAFGEEPDVVLMSDIFQDHFEEDNASDAFTTVAPGYTLELDTNGSEVRMTGDGTSAPWDPFAYVFRNPATLDTFDLDMSANNKLYIKAKSNVPGTAIRIDVQDIDGFATTEGSITKILSEEYEVYEYDFTGVYNDLGFGGTPCTPSTAPCPVNPTRIGNLVIFIEPGVGEFLGTVSLDYISFGTSLDPPAPPGVLIYGDHCNNNSTANVVDPFGLVSSESGTDWIITGDGTSAPFSALAYSTFDQTTNENIIVDATGNNKFYIRAQSTSDVPMRIDLVDTAGFVTSLPSLTRTISSDFQVFEFDYSGQYSDGGYGGTPCMSGPCPVDGSAIGTILFYPNPVDGGFDGTITVDFVSFGAPLDVDFGPVGVPNYNDHYENEDLSFISDISGLVSDIDNSEWTITGDGTNSAFSPVIYDIHDQINGSSILASVQASGDKLFIRAKSSIDGTALRIDLQDQEGFATTEPSVERTLSTDFTIIEYDFASTYMDGGYGGTPCTAGPCPVDGERVDFLQFFIDATTGAFNGTITIDWIAFGQPFNDAPTGLINYEDDYNDDDLSNISDMDGLVSSISDGEWTITGDGTSGAFSPVVYQANDSNNDSIAIDVVGSNDLLYIFAKSSVDNTALRIDLQDAQGYVTSNPSIEKTLTTEYAMYEYDYTNTYTDGGFGGTPCTGGPCPVDGQRVAALQFFLNPGSGAFDGALTIDWISFGAPLVVNVEEIMELEALRIFPNPASDQVGVELSLTQESEVIIRLYDQVGRLIIDQYEQTLLGNQLTPVDISSLDSGLYFLQVNINNQITQAIPVVKK